MSEHRRRWLLTGRPGSATPGVTPSISAGQDAIIRGFAGPFINSSDMPSGLAWWDTQYVASWDFLWDTPAFGGPTVAGSGAAWNAGNSTARYEPDTREFVQGIRFADPGKYWTRAVALVHDYRDNYIIPSSYGPIANYLGLEGMTLDWLLNGDTLSRDTVINTANRMVPLYVASGYLDPSINGDIEPRIWARILDSAWCWEKINGVPMAGGDGIPYIDKIIALTLPLQNASGFWALASYCNLSDNWIQAHYLEYLTRIYDKRPGAYNAAILAAVGKFLDFLIATQYVANPGYAFYFVSSPGCLGVGGDAPARDLNAFFLPLLGWYGARTGNSSYWAMADLVLVGMQPQSLGAPPSPGPYSPYVQIDLYKQFTEFYHATWRYFGYRYGGG